MQIRKGKQTVWPGLTLILAATASTGALAAQPIQVDVNGNPVEFTSVSPVEVGGSVLVPLRGVFEAMGASVNYDPFARVITAKRGTQRVELPLGSTTASVNGMAETLSQPARVIDGTTLVPLRFVAEALGSDVEWNSALQTVAITTPEMQRPMVPVAESTGEGVPQAAGPLVTAFDVDADHPLRAGDILHATLKGTQGGSAEMSIPGAAKDIPMTEVSPGVYRADFQVPSGIAVEKGSVLARLQVIGHTSPIIQAPEKVTIDAIEPRVSSIYPENGATVENGQPLIFATLTDTGGIGVDPKRTKVFLDGQDVTGSSTVTGSYVDVEPSEPLAPGQHDVRVTVVDSLGNRSTREWPFTVSSRRLIDRFQTNVQPGQIVNAGTEVRFTMQGPANGDASASILGVAPSIPLRQVQPGLYKGSYMVKPGDNAAESPIVGRIRTADGREITTMLSNGISVAAGTPPAPEIISPTDGSAVNGNVTVAGTAPPLSTVRVTVGYNTKAAGNLVNLNGTSATREVTADAGGNWSIDNLPVGGNPIFSNNGNTQYTITAQTVDPNGQRSPESTITVEGGRVYAHRRGQQ